MAGVKFDKITFKILNHWQTKIIPRVSWRGPLNKIANKIANQILRPIASGRVRVQGKEAPEIIESKAQEVLRDLNRRSFKLPAVPPPKTTKAPGIEETSEFLSGEEVGKIDKYLDRGIYGFTDVGKGNRDNNEDAVAVYIDPSGKIYLMVADGMGGPPGGEIASFLVIDSILNYLKIGQHALASIISMAHWRIMPGEQMGTTLAIAAIEGDTAIINHLGDSCVYLIKKDGSLFLLTLPHWPTTEDVYLENVADKFKKPPFDEKTIEEIEEYRTSKIYYSLGGAGNMPDSLPTVTCKLEAGDRLLIVSDGLPEVLTLQEIKEITSKNDPVDVTVRNLKKKALQKQEERGEGDNLTVLLYEHGYKGQPRKVFTPPGKKEALETEETEVWKGAQDITEAQKPRQKPKIKKLPLYTINENGQRESTSFFLEIKILRQESGGFYLEMSVNFGKRPPQAANIEAYGSDLPPSRLVMKGKPLQEIGFPIELSPEKDKVTLVISTDGSNNVPKKLFAELKNKSLEAANKEKTSQNMHQQLHLLGELFTSENLVGSMNSLRKLVEIEAAHIEIIEAGVRGIYSSEHKIDFSKLSLNDPTDASILVFHPETPFQMLSNCFLKAFENTLDPKWTEEEKDFWEQLTKAALLSLSLNPDRRGFFKENLDALSDSGDKIKLFLMERLQEWLKGKLKLLKEKGPPPTFETKKSIENYLKAIKSKDASKAYEAAIKILTRYNFINISRLVD